MSYSTRIISTFRSALILLAAATALASAADVPVEKGTLPDSWITGGPNCLEVPNWQIHEYNPNLYILRQSGCTHYEKPFLYLFFGAQRALLIDTGAGASDAAAVVEGLIAKWIKRENRAGIELTVAHSHSHADHTAGDAAFASMKQTALVPATVDALKQAFGISSWPDGNGSIDLGGRVVNVIPIPGHDAAHVAYYDRQTGILHTGDHLYPGRLYVRDLPAYLASTQRLVQFTAGRPVAHILGCHIEQTSTPFVDYPVGTHYQPREHSLALGRGQLLELLSALEALHGKPERTFLRDFTIWPREPRK